ncbi:MAG: hypothetical protein K5622_07040 [Endomicrobiaceae bacterium]|nr:hypothetical protein [Endomicrobiaceae bacterium]
MNISVNKIKQFIKKLFDFSEENSSVEIMLPDEENCNSSEEKDVYEKIICKIKRFFKWFKNSLKESSSVEIVFPKENSSLKEEEKSGNSDIKQ